MVNNNPFQDGVNPYANAHSVIARYLFSSDAIAILVDGSTVMTLTPPLRGRLAYITWACTFTLTGSVDAVITVATPDGTLPTFTIPADTLKGTVGRVLFNGRTADHFVEEGAKVTIVSNGAPSNDDILVKAYYTSESKGV